MYDEVSLNAMTTIRNWFPVVEVKTVEKGRPTNKINTIVVQADRHACLGSYQRQQGIQHL